MRWITNHWPLIVFGAGLFLLNLQLNGRLMGPRRLKRRLRIALVTRDLPALKDLLEKGFDVNEPVDGVTPLGRAISCNFITGAKLLLEYGASINPSAP